MYLADCLHVLRAEGDVIQMEVKHCDHNKVCLAAWH